MKIIMFPYTYRQWPEYLYLLLISFIFLGVFVTASKSKSGKYEYNTTLVVFLSEVLKLVASSLLYTYNRE